MGGGTERQEVAEVGKARGECQEIGIPSLEHNMDPSNPICSLQLQPGVSGEVKSDLFCHDLPEGSVNFWWVKVYGGLYPSISSRSKDRKEEESSQMQLTWKVI